jgi:serine/threonine protein kinase
LFRVTTRHGSILGMRFHYSILAALVLPETEGSVLRKGFKSVCRLLRGEKQVYPSSMSKWGESKKKLEEEVQQQVCGTHWSPRLGGTDEVTDRGNFALESLSPLAASMSSVIMTAKKDERPYVVKYVNSCQKDSIVVPKGGYETDSTSSDSGSQRDDTTSGDDLLLDEFAIQKVVHEMDDSLCPDAITLSETIPGGDFSSPKLSNSRMFFPPPGEAESYWTTNECAQIGAKARAMVQERVGPALKDFIVAQIMTWNKKYLRQTIQAGIKMIDLVERLHRIGFIHDDLHPGNVATISGTEFDPNNLVLIDFGLSRFFPDEIGSDEHANPQLLRKLEGRNSVMLTPWQNEGMRSGRRDDVFSVIRFTLESIIKGTVSIDWKKLKNEGVQYENTVFSAVSNVVDRKYTDFFDGPNIVQPMRNALMMVLAIRHTDDTPDYSAIRILLNDALGRVTPRKKTN